MYVSESDRGNANTAQRLSNLQWWGHGLACLVQSLQTIALLIAAPRNAKFYADVRVTYNPFPSTAGVPPSEHIGTVHVHWLLFIFPLLAALHHLAAACTWDMYRMDVAAGRGWMAWLEYSASASIMNVIIAWISGVSQLGEICVVALATCTTMAFGWAAEAFASTRVVDTRNGNEPLANAWCAFFVGFVPFVAAWLPISFAFHYARQGAPWFVSAIFGVMIGMETLFAVNLWWYLYRLDKSRPVDVNAAIDNEWGKIVLSLTAKTLLAWIAYGGLAK